ncbi:hypothetical protein NA56DRAFT_653520 [Hyaloscypha hepaticicola]|uniref:Uncharacterized protein n=1 Tax=Hyaloscypha hepaticicola TaxID=2082293 RepID=A0A2J6QN26_9HELO|nr:hypothetical protein NA56DRAFT_653520 [Hyaloscypha hepaticicola]
MSANAGSESIRSEQPSVFGALRSSTFTSSILQRGAFLRLNNPKHLPKAQDYVEVDLSPKRRRGHPKPAKQNRRQPRTAHHKPVLNPSMPTQPSDRPASTLIPETIHNPTQQHISQSSSNRNPSKQLRATQNRQALSFDSNSRWVPSWTLNSFCHSGGREIKFVSTV